MDAGAYLQRIGYRGGTAANIETLRALHRAHLYTVPFENLDIHLGREIVLDEDRLFEKIVRKRRGGFCYELNGLFASLLTEIGFRVTMLSAGVAREAGGFGPEFDHLALLVEADGPHLADVGFGEGFLDPLPFGANGEYRIDRQGEAYILMQGERPRYRFTLTPHVLTDFTGMCRYHQTSPQSSFTRSRVVTLVTADGRSTLTDTRFILTRNEARDERTIEGNAEFLRLCEEKFGMRLT